MRFSDAQIELYSRQIILRELGGTGQEKLLAARCLALGGGPALDAALSYLAGAGLGSIDLLPLGPPYREPRLPFAALAARSPDLALRTVAAASDVSLEDYELALLVASRDDDLPASALPPGRPTLGSIAVLSAQDGTIDVALLPRGGGCLGCLDGPASGAGTGDRHPAPDVASVAGAGVLAALAACRWIAGLERDPRPRALRLGAASAVWREVTCALRASCPRGCPVATQSV